MKLIVSLIELIVSQCQLVIMYSVLWWKNSSKGKRLRRNENLIDEVAYDNGTEPHTSDEEVEQIEEIGRAHV